MNNTLINKTFNRLTIMSLYKHNNRTFAQCKCSCEKLYDARLDSIKSGKCKSCGCLLIDKNTEDRKYKYNDSFFLSDTNEMYYVLGLFYSDGNLAYNRHRFEITLKSEDKYLLERINKLIKNDSKLFYNKSNNTYKILGDSQKLYQQLLFHGLTPKKSKTIIIKKELVKNTHFWRGMIDGDGCIYILDNRLHVSICGTLNVCSEFKEFCSSYIPKLKNNTFIHKTITNHGVFQVNGKNAFKILNILYKDKGELFLERKHNKFLEVHNKYPNKNKQLCQRKNQYHSEKETLPLEWRKELKNAYK